jgi:hypothetical protein
VRTATGTTAADLDAWKSASGVRAVIDAFQPSAGLAFRAWKGHVNLR